MNRQKRHRYRRRHNISNTAWTTQTPHYNSVRPFHLSLNSHRWMCMCFAVINRSKNHPTSELKPFLISTLLVFIHFERIRNNFVDYRINKYFLSMTALGPKFNPRPWWDGVWYLCKLGQPPQNIHFLLIVCRSMGEITYISSFLLSVVSA